MKVLPVMNGMQYQKRTTSMRAKPNMELQTPVVAMQNSHSNPSFKRGGALSTAAIFGTIFGGTALFFAAPVAVIAGVTLVGLLSGAALADGK